jgi:hypothetical protein
VGVVRVRPTVRTTTGSRSRRPAAESSVHNRTSAIEDLQRSAGNHAVARMLQRDAGGAGASPYHPAGYASFGDWLGVLPGGATDAKAVDVTGAVGTELPYLRDLVIDLRADCADVTIILKHYYYALRGKTISIPGREDGSNKRITYEIGFGVSKEQLRHVTSNLGTVHFQDMRKLDHIVTYYGGTRPIVHLAQLLAAGLSPGDVLVWKKKAGIKGRFSGHIQTVQHVWSMGSGSGGSAYEIDVLQGTMENEKAKGQIQSKKLSAMLLTGDPDGNGPITFEPGNGEEVFYGAGKWEGGA